MPGEAPLDPPDEPEPDEPLPEEPAADDPLDDPPGVPEPDGAPLTVAPVLGCMAEEPEVVEPEPEAVGRSVDPEGAGVD